MTHATVVGLAAAVPAGTDLSILWVALVAVFTSVTAPLMLAYMNSRQQRKTRDEDYARQDQVAAKAAQAAQDLVRVQTEAARESAETARLLLENQKANLAGTQEVARVAAAASATANAKLDGIDAQTRRIHILVNSEMTAARQAELDQANAMVVVLTRVLATAAAKGIDPDPRDVDTLERTKARRDELEVILADRLAQLSKVDADPALTAENLPIADPGEAVFDQPKEGEAK
jgi:hypothetical protein